MISAVLAGCCLASAAGCGSFLAQARNGEGVRLFEQQARYHDALREFQEASYADPTDPTGYYNQARTYHQLGLTGKDEADLTRAEDMYNLCLDVAEDYPSGFEARDCYRGLAVLLAQQGRHDEAFRLIEGWADNRPDDPEAKIELARLCEEFGNQTEAETHLVDALKAEPHNARALAALGKISEEKGEPQQALRNYQRSLQSNRFQEQVASRVSVLQSTMGAPVSTTDSDGRTRLVDKDSGNTSAQR
ncbi:MAG TPA: tetratricopeptide repeat protein [Thermoguttaceae bacterium]|nr:tetratricopeptide repeat protein [Thermoguttaceae bacterium]